MAPNNSSTSSMCRDADSKIWINLQKLMWLHFDLLVIVLLLPSVTQPKGSLAEKKNKTLFSLQHEKQIWTSAQGRYSPDQIRYLLTSERTTDI